MTDLFRKSALDTMATPEQLDKQVKIVRPATWLMGIALLIGLITFILWSIFYTISDGVNVSGVVFTNNGVRQMKATRDGVVMDVLVKEGDQVEIGDIIAVFSDEETKKKIEQKKEELLFLEAGTKEYRLCEERIEQLTESYIARTMVKSNTLGQVHTVVAGGNYMEAGDVIASIVQDSGYKEIVAYVPVQTAQNLSVGLSAQVSPKYAPREEYGYMTGTVTKISDTPVTEDSILAKMGTLSYVEGILPETACVEIHIKLDLDSNSANQYLWSNEKGERLSVEIGTQCSIMIITDEYHPIELLL